MIHEQVGLSKEDCEIIEEALGQLLSNTVVAFNPKGENGDILTKRDLILKASDNFDKFKEVNFKQKGDIC